LRIAGTSESLHKASKMDVQEREYSLMVKSVEIFLFHPLIFFALILRQLW